jgi:predicted AlkP superfamily pyrophosphatase or phosphodiesterase
MKKNRFLYTTIFIIVILIISYTIIKIVTPKKEFPKLVIGIVVDQMSYDFIPRYWNKYSPDGFKRLISNGYFCKNANFIHFPTYTAPGHSCIYTGSVPAINGIVGNDWLEKNSTQLHYCSDDTSYSTVGSFSNEGKMSPKYLITSTVTDELRKSNNLKSKVIGIALKDRGAIFPAGHNPSAAYWYDEESKKWITSTYYMQNLPGWVEKFDEQNLPDTYLSEPWNTLLPIEQYTESLEDNNKFEDTFHGETNPVFPHNLPELKYKNVHLFRDTPFGNTFTKDFAIETIKNENLGKNETPDFLCISFSSTDYVGHKFGPNSIEVEDTYLRLDYDIADLLAYIDNNIGMQNVLIFLTADHGICGNPEYLKSLNYNSGTFFHNVVLDSVNNYLYRTYNIKKLALYFINQQVYLDRKLINDSEKDLNEVAKNVSVYIKNNIEGVKNVYTSSELESDFSFDYYFRFFKNGFLENRCGEVFVNFQPYWIEDRTTGAEHGSPYYYDTHVPLIFYGWNIKKGETSELINMTDVAPTISAILGISFPSGCIGRPIKEVAEK